MTHLFKGLLDSGSLHCLVDSVFVLSQKLLTHTIAPLSLSLIDDTSNNYVSQIISLSIKFACGLCC